MTRVPCPPVKITPDIFRHHSIIAWTANENTGACGEETRVTKREKGNTCSCTIYTYTSPSLSSHQTLPKPLRLAASEKFSWVYGDNPSWQSSKALCRHFVLLRGGDWGGVS